MDRDKNTGFGLKLNYVGRLNFVLVIVCCVKPTESDGILLINAGWHIVLNQHNCAKSGAESLIHYR